MSLFVRPRPAAKVRFAAPADVPRVVQFLERAPAENVYLSHLIVRDGHGYSFATKNWYVAQRAGEVCGVCVSWGNLVPAVADDEAARALGQAIRRVRPGTQSVVGEHGAVNAMWQTLEHNAPAVRLVREEQPFYVLEREDLAPPASEPPPNVRLRPARRRDLELLVTACAAMLREEILDDPYGRDPAGFRGQISRMIRDGVIHVLEAQGRVVFKAHTNVRTPLAVQVSGVYTLPADRGRGFASVGMSMLARELLREYPRLCLYVNGDNEAAIHAYESAGFRRTGTFKTIFFANQG